MNKFGEAVVARGGRVLRGTLAASILVAVVGGVVSGAAAGGIPPHYVNGLGANNGEANYTVLQFPSSMLVTTGQSIVAYGRIYHGGMTEAGGPNANISAQCGFGPIGSDPFLNDAGWTWQNTSYNVQLGNDDEYQWTSTAPAPGVYAYTFRFNLNIAYANADIGWALADLDGTGSNPGLSYSASQLGVMTVIPAPGTMVLLVVGGMMTSRRRR